MVTWNDLIRRLEELNNFAKKIQSQPNILPRRTVTEDEIIALQTTYQEWSTDCLSQLEGDLKIQFQSYDEKLARPFVLQANEIYRIDGDRYIGTRDYGKYEFKKPYSLYFKIAAYNYKVILLQASKTQKDQQTENLLKIIDRNIGLFKMALEEADLKHLFNSTYQKAYRSTELLLREIFSEQEINKFIMATDPYPASDDPYGKLKAYKEHISLCILQSEVYREQVENFGITRTRNYQEHTASNIYAKEFHMGDIINTSMGNVSNSGQLFTGKINEVTATLTASNQQNLAEALKNIQEEIAASSYLTEEEKQDHIDVIAEIGEQAASPQPNKTKLRRLTEWLIPALRSVPDIAKAIESAEPLLKNIHL